jgi:hypothetical protein
MSKSYADQEILDGNKNGGRYRRGYKSFRWKIVRKKLQRI